jgi:hypothetical protein
MARWMHIRRPKMKHSPNVLFHHLRNLIALQMTGLIIAAGLIGGCLSGKPSPFPATPIATRTTPAGDTTRTFDIDGDGRGDYAEVAGGDGRVRELRFAPRLDQPGDPFPPSHESADAPTRHLLLILDSIPFELVRAAYARGEFRLFHPPSQVVSPFPAMTDLCLNEFVGTSPAPGVETQYYDGETLSDGWALYDAEANSPWHTRIDWHLPYDTHGKVYLAPRRGFQAELARIEQALADTPVHRFVAYSVGTSALGFQQGAEGHAFALAKLERFCRMLVQRARGRLNITLMSDHGHALGPSRMLDLRGLLRRGGFHVSANLVNSNDVVLLDFGLVSMAALHTPSPRAVAEHLARAEGVELALYRDPAGIHVVDRQGAARIEPCAGGWRYVRAEHDPLALPNSVGAGLDTCRDADAWFAATNDHIFPDAVDRIGRAFDGMVVHPPDVLLSLADGWHWGSPFLNRSVRVRGTHGNLSAAGTIGFVMSTAGPLPPALRMRDLAPALDRIGVSVPFARRAIAEPD